MKNIRPLLLTLFCAPWALLTGPLSAALDTAIVPAEAQWVVYADFNEMRQTVIGQEIITRTQQQYAKETANDPMNGLNIGGLISQIMETVGSVTLSGTAITDQPEEMDGTAIIQGTAKMRTISEGLAAHMILAQPEFVKELDDLPFEAYGVHDGSAEELVIAFPEEQIVMVSRSREHLLIALEAFRTGEGSLQQGNGALTPMLPTNEEYYLYAASVVPSSEIPDGNEPAARILKMTQSASLLLSEEGEEIVARATLVADSDATATRLTKVVNGMTALLSLAQDSDEELVRFIESVSVEQTDTKVEVQMGYSSAKLVELAQPNLEREVRQQDRQKQEREAQFTVQGELVSDWKGNRTDDESEFITHTSDPVQLEAGTIVQVAGRARGNDRGRIDWVEIVPLGADSGDFYEAEFMRIWNYRIQKYDKASGGEMLVSRTGNGIGRAQLRFNGPAGDYQIKVGYVDDLGGVAHYKVSVQQPTAK